jgi:hypothetical protein
MGCPVDGCEYSGERASVEGHVSALTDEGHQGLTGVDVREEMEEIEEPAEPEEGAESGSPGSAGSAASTAAAGASVAAAGLPGLLGGEDGPSTEIVLAGLVVVAVVAFLLMAGDEGGSGSGSEVGGEGSDGVVEVGSNREAARSGGVTG